MITIGRIETTTNERNARIKLSTGTVVGGITITSLVAAAISFLLFLFVREPGHRLNRELDKALFKMELIDHALNSPDSLDRMRGLYLLIQSNLLGNISEDMLKYLQKEAVPDWSDIEKFESNVPRFNLKKMDETNMYDYGENPSNSAEEIQSRSRLISPSRNH